MNVIIGNIFFDIEFNQELIIPFKFSLEHLNDKTLLGI
jgi:hypothetical protein